MDDETNIRLGFLIGEITRGNIDAVDEIYVKMRGAMMAIAFSILHDRNDAEDVVHDALIKIVRKVGKFRYGKSARAWICTIVKNTALNQYRKNKRRKCVPIENCFDLPTGGGQSDDAFIQDIFSELTKNECDVIRYKYWMNMSVREIAAVLKKPRSTTEDFIKKTEKKISDLYSEK